MRISSPLLGAWLCSSLLAACSAPASDPPLVETARLKVTLATLDLEHPWEDAKRHVAMGDLRPVGIFGFSCAIPGPHGPESPPETGGIRCLEGTTDVAEGAEHRHLIDEATAYAMTYDWALQRALKSAAEPPPSPASGNASP